MKMDTALPPRYRRNLNKSSFVCMGHKETAASIFKAAVSNGRVNRAAARRLFFFCRRPADLCICYESIMRSCA